MSVSSIKSQLLRELQHALTPCPSLQDMIAPPPAYTCQPVNSQKMAIQVEDERAEDDLDATRSPITIKISCPITIVGDQNLIAIDPAYMASTMASCVIRSIKDCSMAHAGIPMIDEEGQPRSIHAHVDAGIIVHGTKNTIGENAVLFGLRATRDLKRNAGQMELDDEQPKIEGNTVKEIEIDEGKKKQKVVQSS